MKGKIVATLFGLPFFAVGVWMLWSISSDVLDAWQMRAWVQVDARLYRGGYETHSGDDSDSYEAYAEYTYSYAGERYRGNRVSLGKGADNIGRYQQETGRRLQSIVANGGHIAVFVDPEEPARSIIYPDLRWGLIGFKSIFLLVFGGFGLGLIIFVWRSAPEKDPDLPEYRDSPWLMHDAWQTPTIRSSSKAAMWGALVFAAFWNLISAPLPFLLYEEVTDKGNYLALIGLVFPLIGIGMLAWAMRRVFEWRRFGPAPVTLDPFPGSIGGHVGGTIDLNIPFDPEARYQLTLNNLHSHVSGSGKSRSRKEEAEWQDNLVAFAEPGARGTKLTFRFDVPEGLNPSDTDHDDSYHVWRLSLHAELSGTDLDRSYDIPVYATATMSRRLSDRSVQKARTEQNLMDDRSVGEILNIRNSGTGRQLIYPMWRHFSAAFGGVMVAAIFAAAGWFLVVNEGQKLFGGVFGFVGTFIGLFCLYLMLNSLEVSKQAGSITSVRRLLGIPVSQQEMHQNSLVHLKKKSTMRLQSGGKHTVFYSILGLDRQGNEILLGEGFRGENEARAAMRVISTELGLHVARRRSLSQGAENLTVSAI
ncbi:MAG: DUF3592 domain-containing protein [Woeseiaceae bacterium]